MSAACVPGWLRGVWRRTYYRNADGVEDRASSVYWLQTDSFYADIRLPEPVLRLPHRSSLSDYSPGELSILGTTRGFAGHMAFDEGVARWHRPIDFQPETGRADVGRLQMERGELWEYGVEEDYVETYHRVSDGGTRLVSLSLLDDSRNGIWVMSDDWMIRAVGRRHALPAGPSLQALIENPVAGNRKLDDVFDCDISLTYAGSGLITLSTQPWRIETAFAPGGLRLVNDAVVESPDSPEARTWAVQQSTESLSSLLHALNGELL
jgi:hypothetical protein